MCVVLFYVVLYYVVFCYVVLSFSQPQALGKSEPSTADLMSMFETAQQTASPQSNIAASLEQVDPYALRNSFPASLPVSVQVKCFHHKITLSLSLMFADCVQVNSYVEGARSITICIGGVDGSQLKATDLQVSGREAVITIPDQGDVKGGSARVGLKFICDTSKVKASMSKKKHTIEVCLTEKQ
jgi:hypothetical protein